MTKFIWLNENKWFHEQIKKTCIEKCIKLAVIPGDATPDPELTEQSTLEPEACHRIWQYCVQSGSDNIRNLLILSRCLLLKNMVEPPWGTWTASRMWPFASRRAWTKVTKWLSWFLHEVE